MGCQGASQEQERQVPVDSFACAIAVLLHCASPGTPWERALHQGEGCPDQCGADNHSEIKLPTSAGSSKKQESSRKTSISALLTIPKPLTVWITINWKILKEMGIPDYLTCLLRNLSAGQEATVRTGHGTTDWFQIGKGLRQGCILSPCLFIFYAEYIMRNTGLEEAQAGIKIARRNINNLR